MLTITPGLIKFADDQIQDLQGIEELDDFQQRFANTFEVNLKQELDKEVDSNGIVSKFESNREEILATLGDEHVVDVDSVVETITAQLTDYVVEDMDTEAVNRKEVHSAVEDAYLHTLDEISKAIPESDRHRLNNELNRKLQQDIEDIDETLEIIKQTLKDVGRRDRQESFRIERNPMGIESLVADKLSRALDEERTFHEPPGFDSHNDRRYVLIYGRKGSGKTRVLTEQAKSLIESQEFDAVVYLDRGFRDFADLESLLQIEYDGDVLLLWDDAHDIGDRDFVKDVLIKFDAYLDETQDNDLWVRMTARR
jgi:signal recognition particle GTPase